MVGSIHVRAAQSAFVAHRMHVRLAQRASAKRNRLPDRGKPSSPRADRVNADSVSPMISGGDLLFAPNNSVVLIQIVIVDAPNFVEIHLRVHPISSQNQSLKACSPPRSKANCSERVSGLDHGYRLQQSSKVEYAGIDTAMFRIPQPQTWRTFLNNHGLSACFNRLLHSPHGLV
jgi:hypothetical protein